MYSYLLIVGPPAIGPSPGIERRAKALSYKYIISYGKSLIVLVPVVLNDRSEPMEELEFENMMHFDCCG